MSSRFYPLGADSHSQNALGGGGVGNVLPIFEFFIRFSIGLRWILQIRLFKFWKLEILCIKIWKLKIRRRCSLAPHLKWLQIFSNLGSRITLYTPHENAVLFRIGCLRRKTAGNVNRPGLLGVNSASGIVWNAPCACFNRPPSLHRFVTECPPLTILHPIVPYRPICFFDQNVWKKFPNHSDFYIYIFFNKMCRP